MESVLISKIVEFLDKALPKFNDDKLLINKEGYNSLVIKKENFNEIKKTPSNKKICFVDGGNTEILKAPNFSLQKIRVYAVIFENNKKINEETNEFYALIHSAVKNDEIIYTTELFPIKGDLLLENLSFNSMDPTLKQGISRAEPSIIGDIIRRFAELKLIEEFAAKLKDSIIVRDGTLESKVTGENNLLSMIYEKAKLNSNTITALSKTTRLFTTNGNSLNALLTELADKLSWYYHPLVEINNKNHQAEIYIIKLNPSSRYLFRFEVYKEQPYEINELLSILTENSKDPIFPGYPYGLIQADKFARLSNKEKLYLQTLFQAKAGKQFKRINHYLNSVNAHDVLDNI